MDLSIIEVLAFAQFILFIIVGTGIYWKLRIKIAEIETKQDSGIKDINKLFTKITDIWRSNSTIKQDIVELKTLVKKNGKG